MKSIPFAVRIKMELYHDLKTHANKIDRPIGWILARAAEEFLARAARREKRDAK